MDRPAHFAPQALAAAVATEVHPHAARRRWWLRGTAQQQPHCKARPHSDAYTGRFAVVVSREAPYCTPTTTSSAHRGPVQAASLPCQSSARRRTEHAATHGGAAPSGSLAGLCNLDTPFVWQAEEAVANLPLRSAVRVHCGHHVRRGTLGVPIHSRGGIPEYSHRILRGAHSLYGYTATGQHAATNALPSAERAFPRSPAGSSARVRLNDRMRGCRGSSCS